ncbi:MAG TPA: outer membrane beta-barrel protein [Thermoanaerobaculia bacterium]|nr:outer membrane beta-barrel protein [Thermoanaerobaculia bacterium]
MVRRLQWFSRTLSFSLLTLIAASSAASAQSGETGASFDLFGAYVRPTDSDADFDTEAYGARGGYRFTNVWALEGSLSRLSDADIWFGDASAKAYFIHSQPFEIYAVTGAGLVRFSDTDDETTVHFGIGAEIGIGQRGYLRPEVRGRWLADELRADDGIVDYSLGFGWRF